MLRYISLDKKKKKRSYTSPVRRRQADDTRRRILEATRHLLETEGYAGMTIEAIARRAEVSAQSVYAIFKSKTGILMELLDQSMFGADYEEAVKQALSADDPEDRLRFVARIARQIHDAESATVDVLHGARVLAPELAKLEQSGETLRYKRQKDMVLLLRDSGRLRPDLDFKAARDVLWMFTGAEVYRMLVRERGWSPQKYETWLGETLDRALLKPKR
jgi:AcrR family transcriptional regulator